MHGSFVSAELTGFTATVGGETIKPPDGTLPPGDDYNFQDRFHSNHFERGDEVELSLSATFLLTPESGSPESVSVSTTIPLTVAVYNRGTAIGISELEGNSDEDYHGVPSVAGHLQAMNHVVTQYSQGWTISQLEMEAKRCTVFYFHGHGSSIQRIYGWNGAEGLRFDDLREWLEAAEAPHVPVSLAFDDACSTAAYTSGTDAGAGQDPGDSTLNHGFSTNGFLYESAGGTCMDRAQVGWRVMKYSKWTKTVANYFFEGLSEGLTAHLARDAAVYELFAQSWWSDYAGTHTSEYPEDYLIVFGDHHMRL